MRGYGPSLTFSLRHYLNDREYAAAWCRIVKRKNGEDWELGAGNFGKVLRGLRGDVQPVAIKTTFKRDKQMEDAFIREIAMMKYGFYPSRL